MGSNAGKGIVLAALLSLWGWGCAPESAEGPMPAVRFADATQAAGLDFIHVSGGPQQRYILEAMGSGVAFFDFDADGWLDVFAVNGTRAEDAPDTGNRLWRNIPAPDSGRAFAEVTQAAGLGQTGWGMGCAVADYDNDGDLDLYVTYWGPNALYRNEGNGTFTSVEAGTGDQRWGASAAFGDVDLDGWLDLYVANYVAFDLNNPPGDGQPCSGWKGLSVFCGPHGLDGQADVLYRNEGNGTFADVSAATGIDQPTHLGLGVLFTDYDGDGDQDIYIANDSTPNLLYRNDGAWRLREVGAFAGVAYSEEGRAQAGMGIDSGDYDNDGDFDVVVTNFSDDVNTLYQNLGNGSFADATYAAGLGGAVRPFLGWSTALADFDLDGWLDLFVANGHLYPQLEARPLGLSYRQRNLLYWNRDGVFALADPAGLEAEQVSRGTAFGDYDNDGDLDLIVNNLNDRLSLLRNDGGNHNYWLGLELVGAAGRPTEGASVRLWADGQVLVRQAKRGYGYLSANDGRVLFGLGGLAKVEKIEVRWPSGRVQVVEQPPLRRYLVLREGERAEIAHYSESGAAASAGAGAADRAYRLHRGGRAQSRLDSEKVLRAGHCTIRSGALPGGGGPVAASAQVLSRRSPSALRGWRGTLLWLGALRGSSRGARAGCGTGYFGRRGGPVAGGHLPTPQPTRPGRSDTSAGCSAGTRGLGNSLPTRPSPQPPRGQRGGHCRLCPSAGVGSPGADALFALGADLPAVGPRAGRRPSPAPL